VNDLAGVVQELRGLEERLRELAYERLRAAAEDDDADAAADEKRIIVARRALERAINALASDG
jgi:hypothetical protein